MGEGGAIGRRRMGKSGRRGFWEIGRRGFLGLLEVVAAAREASRGGEGGVERVEALQPVQNEVLKNILRY